MDDASATHGSLWMTSRRLIPRREDRPMRLWLSLVGAGNDRTVVVTCPPGTTVGRLRRELLVAGSSAGPPPVLYVGPVALADTARLGEPPLLDGTTLGVGIPVPVDRHVTPVDSAESAATMYDGLGHILVNRAPRTRAPAPAGTVTYPAPPEPPGRPAIPVIAACIPLCLSLTVAWVQHSAAYLLFGLLTPAMMIGTFLNDRMAGRRSFRRRVREHQADIAAIDATLTAALAAETTWRHTAYPDRRTVLATASAPGPRLWERRVDDEDHLTVRAGTGRCPAGTAVRRDGRPDAEPAYLENVPITLDLRSTGVLGMCGHRGSAAGAAWWMLAQLAAWHSPQDLRLVLLADRAATLSAWRWLAWLPHVRGDEPAESWSQVGALEGDGRARHRVAELEAVLDERLGRSTRTGSGAWHPSYVVVLVDARRLRAVPGVARLLTDGPGVGIVAVCLDDRRVDLPQECRAVLSVEAPSIRSPAIGTLTRSDGQASGLRLDVVSPAWTRRLARALAPLRDATPVGDGCLPSDLSLLDLVGPWVLDPERLAQHWARAAQATVAVLGRSADGCYSVDLRHDGPHVLVGGTTGSGKSELLQTLVASLALDNPPDQMAFVLVDYKGGAAFAQCARLPHVAGLVTNLDEHLAERALTSLTAELRRREEQLRVAGATDIDEYDRRGTDGRPALGRLVIVIDEFRMLAEELPEFLDGIVRIAALGRSLGVHLVLATQRPAGIVSADIAANVNLRIALRVRDRRDSEDVIESAAAASISSSNPGRAFARVGGAAPVLFQTARVSRPLAGVTEQVQLAALEPGRLGHRPTGRRTGSFSPTSELTQLIDTIVAAQRISGAGAPHQPWLPPLPEVVTLDELNAPEGSWHVPYAIVDRPDRQTQQTLAWDLAGGSHLMLVGTVLTGRTTALRTIAGSLAARFSSAQVHLHAVDGGAGGLSSLSSLPHAGIIATADDTGRCRRLLDRLTEEITARRSAFGAAGFTSLAEQHRHTARGDWLPYVVVLVDSWESVAAQWELTEGGRLVEAFHHVLREGPGVGLRIVLTGDRGLLMSRLGTSVRDRLVLRLADPADLTLAGVPPARVPRHQPCGRAVRAMDLAEVQLALLADDPSGPAQIAALTAFGRAARREAPAGPTPWRVERLPTSVELTALTRTVLPGQAVVVGVGGDAAQPVGLELVGSSVIVAGPPRSGRSTTLATLVAGLVQGDRSVVALTGAGAGLSDSASVRTSAEALTVLGAEDCMRLGQLLSQRPEVVVVVDDVERLSGTETEEVLLRWFKERPPEAGLVLAGSASEMASTFRGLSVVARRSGQGLLLSPAGPSDGDLLGVRLPVPSLRTVGPPGRGFLVREGSATPVQVALPSAADSGIGRTRLPL